ncbi:hypothetical protein GCM10018980_44230 [Streptomyces capoamus]|uniref:Uncharacterized protein n=1 Tax=Streptomyces capoamus TaxID=68183 RepID=A0A919KAR3_9ACTN|nr:hypothetical protein GCM10018980_44230 [Streptomyces capoamus]
MGTIRRVGQTIFSLVNCGAEGPVGALSARSQVIRSSKARSQVIRSSKAGVPVPARLAAAFATV